MPNEKYIINPVNLQIFTENLKETYKNKKGPPYCGP